MAVSNTTIGNYTFALQAALSAYTDEMYTNAKKLVGTGIVGANADIDPTTETFIGQARFFKPYATQQVNVATLTAATPNKQSYTSDFLSYVKTVRTHGAQEINVQRVVSQMDGLAKIARDFAEVKAQDEDNALTSVLKGVAASEGASAGIADFGHDYASAGGFHVDLNAAGHFGASAGTDRTLIMDQSSSLYGGILGENLFKALSLGFADYEPAFMYMICSPEIMTQLRIANLVDQTTVTEGNIEFNTIFSGKFRLLSTRNNMAVDPTTMAGVEDASVKTTFLVKPGAVSFTNLSVPSPVEVYRDANAFNGGGSTDIFYRWGFVAHPMGYTWAGDTDAFASNADLADGTHWNRKFDKLNMGILPIFHA